jgi:Na+-transporting NADH:ubiquinone oxidoreductase subunit NqrC
MKTSPNTMIKPTMTRILIILMIFLLGGTVYGQTPYSLKLAKMTVDGTSSLHDWTSDVTKVEWIGSFLVGENKVKEVKNVQVKIAVTSIQSTKGKIMDNKTYEAFKYEKNPAIIYKLNTISITDAALKANGTLTMAGTTKAIEMSVTAKVLANGDIQLTGSQKLNMRDYKMEPPTAMMGTIKVGEMVTVKFDLTLTPTK